MTPGYIGHFTGHLRIFRNWIVVFQRALYDHWIMALKSKYADILIPEDVSWPQFIYQNFDKFGEKTALVSILHDSRSFQATQNLILLSFAIP